MDFLKKMASAPLTFSWKSYRRHFRRPLRTAHGLWSEREGIIVRVTAPNHGEGFGEIAPIPWFGTETLAMASLACEAAGAVIDAGFVSSIPNRYPCFQFAVESALAALQASTPCEGSLPVAALIPGGPEGESALDRAIAGGFRCAKIKIGLASPADEIQRIRMWSDRLPPGFLLRLDANGGLDLPTTRAWLEAAETMPIEYLEQPLPPAAHAELLGLARDYSTPLGLDESVSSVDELKRWRDRGWPGVFVLKPAIAGRPGALMDEIAQGPGDFVFSSAMETAIGSSAALALAFRAGSRRALGFGIGNMFEPDNLGGDFVSPELTAPLSTRDVGRGVWNQL